MYALYFVVYEFKHVVFSTFQTPPWPSPLASPWPPPGLYTFIRTIIKYLTNIFRFFKSTRSFEPLSCFSPIISLYSHVLNSNTVFGQCLNEPPVLFGCIQRMMPWTHRIWGRFRQLVNQLLCIAAVHHSFQ